MSNEDGDFFHNNRLYHLLTNHAVYTKDLLQEFNAILHEQPELAALSDLREGSYFHIICRNSNDHENASRMIYVLSNAGANPNIIDENGNTPLHDALLRDFGDIGLDLIQALFRVGIDQRIVNKQKKAARAYLDGNNSQLISLYDGYAEGIWSAVETSNVQETERLIKGFIKIDCKHNSNKTLLDTARDINCTQVIRILAEYQVTIEFVHSILACDWDRASLIHQYEGQFIKLNATDAIHAFTWARTTNRTYSKSLLEFCLETNSAQPFDLIFNSPMLKDRIDVNTVCTDGLPFYFHMFNSCFSEDIRKMILSKANLHFKSCKGETFLFHLVHLYDQDGNSQYIETFKYLLEKQPLLLSQRSEQGRTIVDEIELTPSLSYNKFRSFYNIIKEIIFSQAKNNTVIERFLLNGFGYHLLLFFNDDSSTTTKFLIDFIRSLKLRQGLPAQMNDLAQAIAGDDLMKIQHIFKIKTNIYYAKDWSGRTCAHLAVLHRRRHVLNFICENYNNVINVRDNLNRTPLHYACIMNDETMINNLLRASAKKMPDCFNLFPNDYKNNRDLCSEEFHAHGFPKNELEKSLSGISDYLKLSFYLLLRNAIEKNSVDQIRTINNDMNLMGFCLEDLNPDSYVNDWLRGQRYVPLLFLALEYRATSSIQCLMELGLPPVGRMYISKSVNSTNSRCVSFRTRAEELECFDIIGMINDLEDDNELKSIFRQHLSPSGTIHSRSSARSEQQVNKQKTSQQGGGPINKVNGNNSEMRSRACVLL